VLPNGEPHQLSAPDILVKKLQPVHVCVGAEMLAEVARVLDPASGTYICVTLAQPHVLRELLQTWTQ
jgi:hypothetical protein